MCLANTNTQVSSFVKGSIDFVTVRFYVRVANVPQRNIKHLCCFGNIEHRQRVSVIMFEENIC